MASDVRLKEQLPSLTERIVANYREIDKIHHLGHLPLPSYDAVTEILLNLKQVLFPGFRGRQGLHWANITYHVGDLIDKLHDQLTTQICRALRHEAQRCGESDAEIDYEALAQSKAIYFLEQLPRLRTLLATDVQAAYDGDPATLCHDEVIFCYPGLEAVTVQRIAHELYRLQVPFIPRMMTEWAHSKTGIDIHPGASIGESFFIDHGTGVVIGQTCVIGKHVKLYQGVTLGAKSFDKDLDGGLLRGDNAKRHPTIEDHVVIYANATVLGGRTVIGHHAVIGSSVWITKSVAPHSTVALESPKLRIREEQIPSNEESVTVNYQI